MKNNLKCSSSVFGGSRCRSFLANDSRGQALVENVMLIPAIVVITVMLFWFAEIMLTKQQLVMAARYGTDLISCSNLDEAQIRNEIKNYLCGKDVEGRRLDPVKFKDDNNIRVQIRKFTMPKTPWSAYPQLRDAFANTLNNTSYVEIYYQFDAPELFYAFAKNFGGSSMAKKLRIGARSEVLAGTGCQGDN